MKKIKQYTITRQIGQGGMSTVYLAYDSANSKDVAIKLMHDKFTDNKRAQARFAQEAKMVMALNHPAIVPVFDYGRVNNRLYIVMQYMPGGSLRQYLDAGPLLFEDSIAFLQPIASALDAVHAQNIIHRDVKPHNILLDENERAYLADFGVARLMDVDGAENTITLVGTPEFVAPEQADEGLLTPQTDIYQLGVTLFLMLTGQRPFSGTSFQVILQHLNKPFPLAEVLNPQLPVGCDAVLQRATAKNPQDRYPSAGAMIEALTALTDELTQTRLFTLPWHNNALEEAPPVMQHTQHAPQATVAPPVDVDKKKRSHLPLRAFMAVSAVGLLIVAVLLFGLGNMPTSNILTDDIVQNAPAAQQVIIVEDDDALAADDLDVPTGNTVDTVEDTLPPVIATADAITTDDDVAVAANDNPPPPPDGGPGGGDGPNRLDRRRLRDGRRGGDRLPPPPN